MADNKVTVTLEIKSGTNQGFDALKQALKGVESSAAAADKKTTALYGSGATADVKKVATQAANRVTQSHATATDVASKRMATSGGGGIAGKGAAAAGGGEGIAAMAGRFAGPLAIAAAVKVGVDTAANVARISSDKYTTSGEKGRAFAKSLPFGETIQGWSDSFSGRAAAMEEVGHNRQRSDATRRGMQEMESFRIGNDTTQAGLQERARQTAGRGAIMGPNVDRSTAAGETEYRNKMRLLPIEREMRKAEIDQAVATKERGAAQATLLRQKSLEVGVQNQLKNASIRVDESTRRGESGPERAGKLQQKEAALKDAENVQRNTMAASAGLNAATVKEAEAKRAVNNQRASLLDAKAAQSEEIASNASGAASRLGRMNPFERAMAKSAFSQAKATGLDSLPPQLQQMAQSYDPEGFDKIAVATGEKTAEFRSLQESDPTRFGKAGSKAEDYRKEATGLANQAEAERVTGDRGAASAAADAGKSMSADVVKAIGEIQKVFRQELENAILVLKGQMS